jgi:DNA-binding IscR family transcriptional regulator
MDCFLDDSDGRVQCSHHGEAAGTCSTKLLWTRVQMGVIRSLQRTTLAELVEFDARPTGVTVTQVAPPPSIPTSS